MTAQVEENDPKSHPQHLSNHIISGNSQIIIHNLLIVDELAEVHQRVSGTKRIENG